MMLYDPPLSLTEMRAALAAENAPKVMMETHEVGYTIHVYITYILRYLHYMYLCVNMVMH